MQEQETTNMQIMYNRPEMRINFILNYYISNHNQHILWCGTTLHTAHPSSSYTWATVKPTNTNAPKLVRESRVSIVVLPLT